MVTTSREPSKQRKKHHQHKRFHVVSQSQNKSGTQQPRKKRTTVRWGKLKVNVGTICFLAWCLPRPQQTDCGESFSGVFQQQTGRISSPFVGCRWRFGADLCPQIDSSPAVRRLAIAWDYCLALETGVWKAIKNCAFGCCFGLHPSCACESAWVKFLLRRICSSFLFHCVLLWFVFLDKKKNSMLLFGIKSKGKLHCFSHRPQRCYQRRHR